MLALILVESYFGNTRAVADAIADGLSPMVSADVLEIPDVPDAVDSTVDLLVVGGPTHALGMSRPNTRQDAVRQAELSSTGAVGVREWLASATSVPARAAAFDTRIDKGWVPGSAAKGIAKGLRRLGATLIEKPMSFKVTGTPGPLADGELDRARAWGAQLAQRLVLLDGRDRRT